MIERTALTGTFPDERVCRAVSLALLAVALLMFVVALFSWLKGK